MHLKYLNANRNVNKEKPTLALDTKLKIAVHRDNFQFHLAVTAIAKVKMIFFSENCYFSYI